MVLPMAGGGRGEGDSSCAPLCKTTWAARGVAAKMKRKQASPIAAQYGVCISFLSLLFFGGWVVRGGGVGGGISCSCLGVIIDIFYLGSCAVQFQFPSRVDGALGIGETVRKGLFGGWQGGGK